VLFWWTERKREYNYCILCQGKIIYVAKWRSLIFTLTYGILSTFPGLSLMFSMTEKKTSLNKMLDRNTITTLIFNPKYTVSTLYSLSFPMFHVTDIVVKWMLAKRWHCFWEQLSLDESTITHARREENLCVKKPVQEKFYISAT
jgi:hypothetical protein